jgi:hypothetical protein
MSKFFAKVPFAPQLQLRTSGPPLTQLSTLGLRQLSQLFERSKSESAGPDLDHIKAFLTSNAVVDNLLEFWDWQIQVGWNIKTDND